MTETGSKKTISRGSRDAEWQTRMVSRGDHFTLSSNVKPTEEVVKMKRNGLTVTSKELQMRGKEIESEVGDINQKCEIPIINPTGEADGWILEEPAS